MKIQEPTTVLEATMDGDNLIWNQIPKIEPTVKHDPSNVLSVEPSDAPDNTPEDKQEETEDEPEDQAKEPTEETTEDISDPAARRRRARGRFRQEDE